jgi:outer membrane receptor protein involved in Fe transport
VNGNFTDEGFFSSWSWDANFIYGRNDVVATKQGSLVRHKLGAAIGPSFFDSTGTAVCGTPDNPLPPEECVPLNLFGGPGSITPDQVNNLTYNGTSSGFAMQRMVNVGVGGSIFELWNRPVGLALGYAFRREDGGQEPDPLTAAGDTTGNKGLGVEGGYSENAAFAEIDVPLLADLPGVQLFELSAAVRGFNFSTFGGGSTYKLGGRWQVFEHLALRGTYSTAFRAPSIAELYSGASDNFPDVMDPCSTLDRSRTAEQDANCKADGVANDFQDDRAQLLSKVGGNPALGPEEAKTFTAGMVVTPKGSKFLDGLSLTLDYYQIKVTNAIQAKGAEVIINNCYNFSNRSDCELVHRDSEGFVTLIDDLQTNVGGNTTAGFDIGLVYNIPTDFGSFRLNFDANVLQKFDDIRATRTIKGKGVYDLEAVYAPLRFNAGLGWGFEGFTAGFATRYTASFTECENNDCSQDARDLFAKAAAAAQDPNDPSFDPMFNDTIFHERTVSAYAISDIYAGYAFTSSLGYTSIQAGINNLFDTPPPRVYNAFAPNSDPSAYDFLGRFFYVGVRHSL